MPKCELCGFEFRLITASHLKSWHRITTLEYMVKFPSSSMRDKDFIDDEEARRIALSNAWWGKPEEEKDKTRQALSESHRGIFPSDDTRKRMSESTRAWQGRPGYKEEQSKRMSEIMTEVWKRPEYKKLRLKQMSEITRENWKDPQYRKTVIEAWHKAPPLDERLIILLLDEKFPGDWVYTGSKPFIEGGRRPDWTHSTQKKVILYEGYFWHSGYLKPESTSEEKIQYYFNLGYDCLILDEADLWLDSNVLIQKVEKFLR